MVASADTLFDMLDSAFCTVGEPYFRRFMRCNLTERWTIAADFVIGEPEAVHDVFAFTVFPQYGEFTETLTEIADVFPRDLKQTKVLTDEMVTFLRDAKRFHFCFLVEKDRYVASTVSSARVAIKHALRMVRGIDTGGLMGVEDRRDVYVQALRIVEEAAKAKRFNFQNFFDIHILSVLFATIMLWIVRHGDCRLIGLFPDRDKMTTGYKSVFSALTHLNHSGFCRRVGLSSVQKVLMPSTELLDRGDFFYDELIRVPDYVAGALSRLDYHSRMLASEKSKHKDLVERFVSGNPNLLVIQISESIVSLRASTITLTKEQRRFPAVGSEDFAEYVAAKIHGFRRPQRRSYRECLLDHASEWPRFRRMFRSLLMGVAAGDPGCIATFSGKT